MSRRRIEQGVTAGSSFSLRTAISDQAAPTPHVFAAVARRPATSPPAIPSTAGLSFKFNQPLGGAALGGATKTVMPPQIPSAFPNPFLGATAVQSGGHDVMRLTAAADDLRSRLKSATDRASQLETQLQRSHQMLAKERQDAQHQISSVRQEVATVRDAELKLRSELASRPTVTEFKQNKFHDAVRTAMEAEEMQARVADSEARIANLTKRAEALQAEVKLLEASRADAIEVAAANSKAMFTEEQISEKLAALAEVNTKSTAAEERLSVLTDDIAKCCALRDSHQTDISKAELELVTANEALVAAVGDLSATKQEQAEIGLNIKEMKEQLASIEAGIDGASAKAVSTEALPVTSVHRNIEVTGEMHPDTMIGFPTDANTRNIDAMGCSGCGIPFHLNIDSPIALGAATDTTGATPIDDMVKAIVADLKGYLAFAVEENAKRGLVHGSPTGESAGQQIEVM